MPSAFPGGGTLAEAAPLGTIMSAAPASPGAPAAGELAAAAAAAAASGLVVSKGRLEEESNVTVAVRVRPLTEQEKLRMKDLKQPYMAVDQGRQITVRDASNEPKPFAFDYCFDSRDVKDAGAAQAEVFEAIGKKVLTHAWEGFNTSVFAYGQTGSGKTYTMMGGDLPEEAGLLPRVCHQLFQAIEEAKARNRRKNVNTRVSVGSYGGYRSSEEEEEEEDGSSSRRSSSGSSSSEDTAAAGAKDSVEFGLRVQYLEIYNERIFDLLSATPDRQLKLREPKDRPPFVEGATTQEVSDWAGMQALLQRGQESRRVAATRANVQSSRSHAIFFLELRQLTTKRSLLPQSTANGGQYGDVAVERTSTICLVDLAGSERVTKTGATGAQLEEAKSINLSLMTLSRVMTQLAKGDKQKPPYRDSKLTHLLKDFLGGNAKTFMLATVSPAVSERGETLGTLGYANQAKSIVTRVHVNEDPKDREIRLLQQRVDELTEQLAAAGSTVNPYAFPGEEAPQGHAHAHHSSISGSGSGKLGGPALKVDGKEAGTTNLNPAAGGPLSPAGSAADYSVVTASSTDESGGGGSGLLHPHQEAVPTGSSSGGFVASAISSAASMGMGHRRLTSKSSEISGSGSGSGSTPGTTTHGRSPSHVSRLPRLANSSTTLAAGAVAAPALHTPLSPPFLPGSPQLAAAGAGSGGAKEAAVPKAAAAATANIASPSSFSTPGGETGSSSTAIPAPISHKLAAAVWGSGSGQSPGKAAYRLEERMTVEEALALKARFLRAEAEVGAQARRSLGQQQLVNQLTARVLTALPLVLEANAMAQASNKPVAFYLDVVPRAVVGGGGRRGGGHKQQEKAAQVMETLQHLGHAALAEAMGLPTRNELARARATNDDAPAPLLPALLEAAEEAPTVVVRAVSALSDGVAELSIPAFKEALQAMHAACARPGGPMPLVLGFEPTGDVGFASGAVDGKPDPFHLSGQDSMLARSDVYLSALLGNRNVLGAFPLLRGLDGACVGTVQLKLIPQADLPESPVGSMEGGGYALGLELEELVVDKAPLGQLATGNGAWNAAQDNYQPSALRYPDEGVPGLVLRYGFWPADAPCGEVALSPQASTVRELAGRGGGGEHQVRFPVAHKAVLQVGAVTPAFLAYLATGALRLTLHLTKDPAEDALWARHQGMQQYPSERCQALCRVRSLDPPVDAALLPTHAAHPAAHLGRYGAGSYGGGGLDPLHEEEEDDDEEVHAAMGGGGRGHRRRPAMRGLMVPEEQEVDVDDDDRFSVMGSVAPPGAFETCSRLSLRMAGSRIGSVRRSAVTRHAAHFYGRRHPDTACFLFMAVDLLEPVLEPGIDYFNELPTKYLPVDIKPVATGIGVFKGGKAGRQLGAVPDARATRREEGQEEVDDGMMMGGVEDGWDSDMDSVASGFPPAPSSSAAGSVAGGGHGGRGGYPPHLAHLQQVDWASGANAVFHVTANPLIRNRRLRVVLEQVGPLSGPMLLESCLRVRASSYVSLSKREYTGDVSDYSMCATDLEVVTVTRSACKRRIEVLLNLPGAQVLSERCPRGERVVLALEVAAFVEGAAQPVVVQRNVVMKVLPPERKQSVLYRVRKTLAEPLSDRLHLVGSYYAVKAAKGSALHETVADFVQFKLAAREQLLRRMERARALQEGGDARPDLRDCGAWRAALVAGDGGAGKMEEGGAGAPVPLEVEVGADATVGALAGTMLLNVAERRAVAAALFGVDLKAPGVGVNGVLGAARGHMKRGADGVERLIPASEDGRGGGAMAARAVTYEHPARGTGQQAARERERCWDALSRLWAEEVPDFPTTREGFLNLGTGLLGVQSTRMWFVWRRPFLFIYKGKVGGSHGQQAPVDVVNVTDCSVRLGKDELDFEIKGPHKTWRLQASGEEDLTAWILALGQPVPDVTDGCGNLLIGPGGGGGGVPLLCYGGPAPSDSGSVASGRSYYSQQQQQTPSRASGRY